MPWSPAHVLDTALAIVFQTSCLACGRLGARSLVCEVCEARVPLGLAICECCGEGLPERLSACGRCTRARPRALVRARSLMWLTEPARVLLHRAKYGRRPEVLGYYRRDTALYPRADFPSGIVVVPVPMHPTKLVARGFNQAERLARWLGRDHGLEVSSDGLRKLVPSTAQARLTRRERMRNLRGHFAWAKAVPPPEVVLLVDDVMTTGATLRACARALRRAGAREVYGLTWFRTPHADRPGNVPF